MVFNPYSKIIDLILQASHLAKNLGVANLFQPGLVKEIIIADCLGHRVLTSKRHADACDPNNSSLLYEYLSCKEGGSGQLDRMFKSPPERRAKSLRRLTRNHKIFFIVFYADNQTKIKTIYELDVSKSVEETERQLNNSKNVISHVGFSEQWALGNGKVVYKEKT